MSLIVARKDEQIRVLKDELATQRRLNGILTQSLQDARARRKVNPIRPVRSCRKSAGGDLVRVIVSDSHGSGIDPVAIGAILADIKSINPDHIVLLGDHVDCGGFLAQHHTLGFVAETEYSYEDDVAAGNRFLDQLQAAAPRAEIEYIEGNHEQRIERWVVTETLRHAKDSEALRRVLAPNFKLKLKERGIAYYRESECYDNLTIPGTLKRGKCFFTHGAYALGKGAAEKMVKKFMGNVVFGNTHFQDQHTIDSVARGTITAWNPGCTCKKQPMWQHTNPTGWTQGFGMQLVSRSSGNFLHLNIPVLNGLSLLKPLLHHHPGK